MILFGVVVAGAIWYAIVIERRRTRAIEQAAKDLGMTFESKPSHQPGSAFELMRRGGGGTTHGGAKR